MYKQTDILSKDISFAHYGRMIRSGGKMAETDYNDNVGLDEESFLENDDSDELDDEDKDPNTKFHYIITERDGLGEEIPQYTKLKTTLPKENPIQSKRTFPAALRFHKVNKDNISTYAVHSLPR